METQVLNTQRGIHAFIMSGIGPDRNCTGGIWTGTGSGLVPVNLAGTSPVPQFFFHAGL